MTEPDDPSRFERAKSSFFAGLDCFESGEFEAAEQHFLASLDAVPGRASTLVNLAATQLELARPGGALASADAALRAEPDGLDALLHRATALMQLGRHQEALPAFDRLLTADGGVIEAWFRRGQTLERLGRRSDALASFQRVVALDPTRADAWSGCGTIARELGRLDDAANAFREALRHGADRHLHEYYLASVAGQTAPPVAPREYVRTLFDEYADAFETHLVSELRYRGHLQLVEGLVALGHGRYQNALDLGCGTGLCGPLLRPMAERLTGIDLAPKMLEKAAARAVYDTLEADDAVDYLRRADRSFDLVVAADVFIYFGDLAPTFAAVRAAMDHGVFCFSVELLDPGGGDFELRPSLRYAHSEADLLRLAEAHGFALIEARRGPVREDEGRPVAGLFVFLAANPR
jgi:predicted TPR repeat methyltransferase